MVCVVPPKLSLYEMEALENGFLHGTIPDNYQIDRKSCLLQMYEQLLTTCAPPIYGTARRARIPILISPMRYAGAARLTVDSGCSFQWMGWRIVQDIPDIEMVSHVDVWNTCWTRYVESAITEVVVDCLKLYNTQ